MRAALVLVPLALALVAGIVAASCDASLTESCATGPCVLGSGGAPSFAASVASASSGGSIDAGDAGDGAAPDALACPTTPRTGDIPCDVFAVLHASCNPCHTSPPVNGAPFPLLTYADTQEPYGGLIGTTCAEDADCGPSPGSCVTGHCNGLRFQQMWISVGPHGDPQMPFGEGMLPEPAFSTLYDWLGACAPPVPTGTGCGCPGPGCDGGGS